MHNYINKKQRVIRKRITLCYFCKAFSASLVSMWCQISQARFIKGVESMLFSRWASSCLLARFAHLMVISRFIIGAILRYTANCSFIISCIILSRFRRLVHGLVHEPHDKPGWPEPLNSQTATEKSQNSLDQDGYVQQRILPMQFCVMKRQARGLSTR